MKIVGIILAVIGALAVGWWFYSRAAAKQFAKRTSDATTKADAAANVQSNAKDQQAGAAYGSILPPAASWVRANAGIIDLNVLGGDIPALVTIPFFSPNFRG